HRLAELHQPDVLAGPSEPGHQLEGQGDRHRHEEHEHDLLGGGREDRLVLPVAGEEQRPPSHTRRISLVPNSPYGRTMRNTSMSRYGTLPPNPTPSTPVNPAA